METLEEMLQINLGDKLWFIAGNIIVPVTVVEISDVYTHPEDSNLGSCWHNKRLNEETEYVSAPTKEIDSLGWPIYEKKEYSWLNGSKPVNRFFWIDEPVGHSLQIDGWDGLYRTLQEAQKYAKPSKKKHLRRRLKSWRNSIYSFIAYTWKRNGETHPGFSKLPDKKIYIRKK